MNRKKKINKRYPKQAEKNRSMSLFTNNNPNGAELIYFL
jgi:hypothetical protein